jgi:hypothetical protein
MFAAQLAQILDFPVPHSEVVKDPQSLETFFGSQWEDFLPDIYPLSRLGAQQIDAISIGELSRIYCLDLFLENPDRRSVNYGLKWKKGRLSCVPFDFGEASLVDCPGDFRLVENYTHSYARRWRDEFGFCARSALSVLDGVMNIDQFQISEILSMLPHNWLPMNSRRKFVEWWKAGRAIRSHHIADYLREFASAENTRSK